jgi:hypothetical protein
MKRALRAATAAVLLALAGEAAAAVTLANAWMRPAAPGEDAAAYVDVRSSEALTLVGVTTPVARAVEIVVAAAGSGDAAPRVVPTFAIPAGGETRFALHGNVLRLTGVRMALGNGTPVPLTLEFRDAAGQMVTARVDVEVRGLVVRRAPAAVPGAPGAAPAAATPSVDATPAAAPPAAGMAPMPK